MPSPTRPLAARATPTGGGQDIPTSTVAAIGGGFVSFALAILFALFLMRISKIYREFRRRRRAGEDLTFRSLWHRDGGFWGFVMGYNGDAALNAGVGAGGRRDLDRWAIWNEWRMWESPGVVSEPQTPVLWEVEVGERGKVGVCELVYAEANPLGVNVPPKADDSTEPTLDLAVLVLMPCSPTERRILENEDDFDDLPEMAIGLATLVPMFQPLVAAESTDSNGSTRDDAGDGEPGHKVKDVVEVRHLEHQLDSRRRAQWKKHNQRWVVEGLDR